AFRHRSQPVFDQHMGGGELQQGDALAATAFTGKQTHGAAREAIRHAPLALGNRLVVVAGKVDADEEAWRRLCGPVGRLIAKSVEILDSAALREPIGYVALVW